MLAPRLDKVKMEYGKGRFRLIKVTDFKAPKTRTYFELRDAGIETCAFVSEDDLKSLIELCAGVLKNG